MMADRKPEQHPESAPDPEEDDLDDLDDVLDEFQPTPKHSSSQPSKPTAPTASGPGRPPDHHAATTEAPGEEEDLAQQLQAGMASLISELDANPDMQRQFEQMMQELIAAGAAPSDKEAGQHLREAANAVPSVSDPAATTTSGSKKAPEADKFSETIRRTMERMQQSDSTASASATGAGAQTEDELLAQMMKDLQAGGEGGEEDFNKMLLNMMAQLTHKEILYEPMKELHEKFPAWMEKNKEKVGKEDLERYKEQQQLVAEIVVRFERMGYSDENEADREYIVERMQKMQAAGSPPPDLVGDMSAAQEALGDLDAGCPTQ